MKRAFLPAVLAIVVASLAVTSSGCGSLKNIGNALTNLKKLQFKLDKATNFSLAGVNISNMSQIGPLDMAKIGVEVAQKRLPVSFTLNVLATNPNDGTGGSQATSLALKRMDWTLLIDERTTINGAVTNRLVIPGNGQSTVIPIQIGLDLMQYFNDKGLNDLANLAMAIGGVSGSTARLKLTARVTVETPVGDIAYPGELTIVNTQFTNP